MFTCFSFNFEKVGLITFLCLFHVFFAAEPSCCCWLSSEYWIGKCYSKFSNYYLLLPISLPTVANKHLITKRSKDRSKLIKFVLNVSSLWYLFKIYFSNGFTFLPVKFPNFLINISWILSISLVTKIGVCPS